MFSIIIFGKFIDWERFTFFIYIDFPDILLIFEIMANLQGCCSLVIIMMELDIIYGLVLIVLAFNTPNS